MPNVSDKQARFMRIAAHDKAFAARNHIPQYVAKEFYGADKAKKQSPRRRKKR